MQQVRWEAKAKLIAAAAKSAAVFVLKFFAGGYSTSDTGVHSRRSPRLSVLQLIKTESISNISGNLQRVEKSIGYKCNLLLRLAKRS